MKRCLSVIVSSVFMLAALFSAWSMLQPRAVAAPLEITPIGTARTSGAGWTGTIQGNVTLPPGPIRPDTFVIQDTTGGLYVFVASGTGVSIPPMQLGDVVQVTGTLKDYNGLLEIDPISALAWVSTGSAPAPQVISTSATIVSATQGLLVQVSGTATWPTAQTLGADWSFSIDDGSGPVKVFVDKDTQVDLRAYTSPVSMTVIGFSGNNFNVPQIMVRYQSDARVPDTTPPTVLSAVPAASVLGVSLYKPIAATFSESLNPATVNTSTFTLVNASGPVVGTVSYEDATHLATFAPQVSLSGVTRYTATLSAGLQDVAGNPLAAPLTWWFITGLPDTVAPTIVAQAPAANASSVPLNSNIVITFSEDLKLSTVVTGNFTLVGPQGAIGWSSFAYAAGSFKVTATPATLLPMTRYTLTVGNVTDWAGNDLAGEKTWSFITQAEQALTAYHGDIHNHTSYSDGSLTPPQALAAGKAAGFDFMAITDHSYSIDDTEWANTLSAAIAATVDGQFVALRGAEYTQGAEGHINVYNTVRHPCRTNSGVGSLCDYTPNLEAGVMVDGFYHWLSITGTQALDSAGTVAQFNHPSWINFNDWAYHPEVSATARLEEVGNGNGTSYAFSEEEYIRSLDYGWKVGATNNADTHSPFWGANTDHRTGVWMAALTKGDLLDALRARRTFATEDKNYELKLKANGAWMGEEIANVGTLAFDISGSDPDGEGSPLVELITFGGQVVTHTHPVSSTFTWKPNLPITPGVHYFYVKVTQPDGDRIVSTPIWTQAAVNIALTDLSVEPTIATIYNPSLLTARVSNRTAQTQTVTVTFQVNNVAQPALAISIPACVTGLCVDGYASMTWQPTITGPVTITAQLSGTPAGDNPDDNARTITMNATDEKVPLVLIDAGHGNVAAGPRDVRMFVNDLTAHGYNVLLNLDQIDATDLNTETVKLLIINAYGPSQFTVTETQNVANFVKAGGSLWLNGLADYAGKVAWAGTTSNRFNELLAAIESTVGYTIPIRVNSDEVLDGNNNNGYPWGTLFHIFPAAATSGLGMNVENIQTWSGCSFIDRNYGALTQDDLGAHGFIAALGDLDAGTGTHGEANATHNTDSNVNPASPFFAYNGTIPLPGAVGYDIPGPAGRLYFYGDANDPFNIFSYTAGDGKQNELYNLETVMWLLGTPVTKTTIAAARAYTTVNQPDKLDQLVWVEGKITAAYGEFFNVLYVQDETGGITIHAPAGDISATRYARGAIVRALGTIGIYEGDTEIEFFEAEQVQIITPTDNIDPQPRPLTTAQAALEANQGWLTQITGTVTAILNDSIWVNDDSGPARAFLDGYNGAWDTIHILDQVIVKGLISEDGAGNRIRVRNYKLHPERLDDVTLLTKGLNFSGSHPDVTTTHVTGGDSFTCTITISNSGTVGGVFTVTVTLDPHVTLIAAPDFTAHGATLTVSRTLLAQHEQTLSYQVRAAYGFSGTVNNTAVLSGDGHPFNLTMSAVTVDARYLIFLPLLRK